MAPLSVLYSFPHPLGRPGIGTTAYQQVRALAELGCEVTVLCASLARPLPSGMRVVTTLAVAGQRVPQRLLGVDRSYRYHDQRAAHELRRSSGAYDVVHTWPLAAEETLGVARRAGIPGLREVPNTHTAHAVAVVAAEHQRLGLRPPPGHSHSGSPARLRREEAEYAAAAGLLVPSEAVARTFLDRGFAAERLLRHRYGYDPSRFGARPQAPTGFVAVFAGRCEPRKGLHHALRAWQAAGIGERGGRLIVCGHFDPAYRKVLGGQVAQPGVEVLDFCDRLEDVLADASVLLLPSVEEGSALVTYEAMASGAVPLVSTAAGAPVRHGHDALVHAPGDVATLAEHLTMLSTDPGRLASLRANAVTSAQELTWTEGGRRLVACYETPMAHREDALGAARTTRPEDAG